MLFSTPAQTLTSCWKTWRPSKPAGKAAPHFRIVALLRSKSYALPALFTSVRTLTTWA